MNKKILLSMALISTIAVASYVAAFAPSLNFSDGIGGLKQSQSKDANSTASQKDKKANELPSPAEFKHWLSLNKNVGAAEKNLAYGMMESNSTEASKYFKSACEMGDDRGCFQLALAEIGGQHPEGLDRLYKIAVESKNKELGQKSAQLLGAYVLDFAPRNKSAVTQSIEAVMPYAANEEDANSQFLIANLLLANGFGTDADAMLNKACNNPAASEKIVSFCKNGTFIDKLDENGKSMSDDSAQTPSPAPACPLKY